MKTMTEMVESIKNQKLRTFATKLQQKLEQARTAIISKKKKVSEAEQSALRNSVSRFTEQNRGKVSQKVAGLLALAVLTTCIASCDEVDEPGDQRPHETGDRVEGLTTETNMEQNLEYDIPSNDFGMYGFLAEIDFGELIGNHDNATYWEKLIEECQKKQKQNVSAGEFSMEECLAIAYNQLLIDNGRYDNVVFHINNLIPNRSGWEHKIVSTQDEFALLSKDSKGNFYVTGLYNNEIRNDAGIINDRSEKIIVSHIKSNGYIQTLRETKRSFFSKLIQLNMQREDGTIRSSVSTGVSITKDPNFEATYTGNITSLNFVYGYTTTSIVDPQYQIPDRYIESCIEQGGATRPDDNHEHVTNKVPEVIIPENPDAIPPHYREDYTEENNYYDEEETTGAGEETEAEIEP